jgi:hypothetical protein
MDTELSGCGRFAQLVGPGRPESGQEGKGVDGALSQGSRSKKHSFSSGIREGVLGGRGVAQEGGPFYIKEAGTS